MINLAREIISAVIHRANKCNTGRSTYSAVKSMVGAITQTVKAGNTKTGMHFVVRHWTSIKKK